MNHIEIPPFYAGQEIIANCDYVFIGHKYFKKGDEFIVKSISKPCCTWVVDIGINNPYLAMKCICNKLVPSNNFLWSSDKFSPKLEFTDFISMKEIMEKSFELTSAN